MPHIPCKRPPMKTEKTLIRRYRHTKTKCDGPPPALVHWGRMMTSCRINTHVASELPEQVRHFSLLSHPRDVALLCTPALSIKEGEAVYSSYLRLLHACVGSCWYQSFSCARFSPITWNLRAWTARPQAYLCVMTSYHITSIQSYFEHFSRENWKYMVKVRISFWNLPRFRFALESSSTPTFLDPKFSRRIT